jgi:hypothetical protein
VSLVTPETPDAVRGILAPELQVTIRNLGDGEFDDGFLVVTLQRAEAGGSKFMRRHHEQIDPIAPMGELNVISTWDVSELKGGEYYFYGHVNYKYLWDVNSLDTFRSDRFLINQN